MNVYPAKRQLETLKFIGDFSADNGFPPSIREMAAHFNRSTTAVQEVVIALQKKGCLAESHYPPYGDGRLRASRSLLLTHWGEFQCYGEIAAARRPKELTTQQQSR